MRCLALGLLAGVALVAAGCGVSKQTRAEVHAARTSHPSLFAIFPATPGRHDCRIPFRQAPFARTSHFSGTCETGVRTVRAFDAKGYIDHQEVAIVSFTERWRWGPNLGPKVPPPPRHTWWVYERLGPRVQVLGSCDLDPGSPYAEQRWPIDDPCKSFTPFGRRTRGAQLKAAFAAQGIHLRPDREPSWPQGNVGFAAPGKVYVEMQLRQPAPVSKPPQRLTHTYWWGFTRQGNVEVWWSRSQPYQLRAKQALRALK